MDANVKLFTLTVFRMISNTTNFPLEILNNKNSTEFHSGRFQLYQKDPVSLWFILTNLYNLLYSSIKIFTECFLVDAFKHVQ